jgi:Rod binding domain-containing protein
MSALSATSLSASLPALDPALEPASVRNGGQKAQAAYQQGMAFENVLVNELAQEMTATAGLDGSNDGLGGSSDSSGGSTGLAGSGSALGAYSSLLPQTLATSVMSAGGTGLALQIAQSIDPALDAPAHRGRS